MVKPKNNRLERTWSANTAKIQADVSLINTIITHQGEKGRANERLLIDLLKKFLSPKYLISPGFVIDKDKECSKQTDIILFDNNWNPNIISSGGVPMIPVDKTYAVIEVKTTLKSKLKTAVENIAKTKSLNYEVRWVPNLESKEGGSRGRGVNVINTTLTSPPIGAIFAYRSGWKNPDTIKKNIDKCLNIVKKEHHPNLICCLMDGYLACYMKYPIKPNEVPEDINHAVFPLYQPGTEDDPSSFISIKGSRIPGYGQLFPYDGVCYPVSKYQGSVVLADCSRTLVNFLLQLSGFMNLKKIIGELDIRKIYLKGKYSTGKAL